MSTPLEENLGYTYEVIDTPRSYYIDTAGKAYLFDPVLPSINATISWLEKDYLTTPYTFMKQNRFGKLMVKYSQAKKFIRQWYIKNLRHKIEPPLR